MITTFSMSTLPLPIARITLFSVTMTVRFFISTYPGQTSFGGLPSLNHPLTLFIIVVHQCYTVFPRNAVTVHRMILDDDRIAVAVLKFLAHLKHVLIVLVFPNDDKMQVRRLHVTHMLTTTRAPNRLHLYAVPTLVVKVVFRLSSLHSMTEHIIEQFQQRLRKLRHVSNDSNCWAI